MTKPVYNVRIDPEIYKKVAILAHLEKRSVTAEVNQLLLEAIMRPGTQEFVAHNLRSTRAKAMIEVGDRLTKQAEKDEESQNDKLH